MSRLVILDRDGVINQDSDDFIKTVDEWQPLPGSIDAIADLSKAGFTIAVATNQSGVGRGLFDESTLAQMHQKMFNLVEQAGGKIDLVVYCPHRPDEGCDCRKPKPGLFYQIEEQLGVDLRGAFAVGDSLRDLQAAVTVGARPVLVSTGKGFKTATEHQDQLPLGTEIYPDLASFVKDNLRNEN